MKEIANWINSDQDYDTGVKLYLQHGSDNSIKNLLNLSKSSFTERKLLQAMKALVPQDPAPESKKESLPEKILDLIRLRSLYHNNLFHTPSQSDRKKLAFAILSITEKLNKYFDAHQDPDEHDQSLDQEIPAGAWDMHQLFNNNRSYITKYKKAEDKRAELVRREAENKIIEERLKSLIYGAIQE